MARGITFSLTKGRHSASRHRTRSIIKASEGREGPLAAKDSRVRNSGQQEVNRNDGYTRAGVRPFKQQVLLSLHFPTSLPVAWNVVWLKMLTEDSILKDCKTTKIRSHTLPTQDYLSPDCKEIVSTLFF